MSDLEQRLRERALRDTLDTDRLSIKAADRLRQYREACELVRETMGTQSNGGTGWMAQFEALAFPPALKETTDVD
jgi:hypothetical protein